MATVAELKAAKREDLDKLAVEQGLDPAQYSKVDDLRAELLKSADDAEGADDGAGDGSNDQNAEKAGGADEENTTTASADQTVNDADAAAAAAEAPAERKPANGPLGHPAGFDSTGNPVFGKKVGR